MYKRQLFHLARCSYPGIFSTLPLWGRIRLFGAWCCLLYTSHWLDIHQSNSLSTMLDSNGEMIPPWGVPFSGKPIPATSAFSIAERMDSTVLSRIPSAHICRSSFPWLTLSKKPLISRSTTKCKCCICTVSYTHLDVIMASTMLGHIAPNKVDKSQQKNIEQISSDLLWTACQQSIQKSLDCFANSGIEVPVQELSLIHI